MSENARICVGRSLLNKDEEMKGLRRNDDTQKTNAGIQIFKKIHTTIWQQ
jgi:hypothetical protein